jgi:hypothetical protein
VKLTLAQWKNLEAKAEQIRQLLNELDRMLIVDLAIKPGISDDPDTFAYLYKVVEYVNTAGMAMSSVSDHVRPISEWVGGETWKWREPDRCYGGLSARRYFTPEEVAEWEKTKSTAVDSSNPVPPVAPSTASASSP